jgi:type IV fimbrial biogenesis protein FimT
MQIRTSAEGVQAGLQLARAEALRRNTQVRFQLVDTLTAACQLSPTGTNWIVSIQDPTGRCDVSEIDPDPNAPAANRLAPLTIQKRNGADGTPNAVVTAAGGATTVTFTGLGRVTGVLPITRIDITNQNGACQTVAGGRMRCLQLQVSSGGDVRMCDPQVTDATDPRFC